MVQFWKVPHGCRDSRMVAEMVSCKSLGVDIHLCLPWQQVHFGVIILVASNMQTLELDAE
jgi:hypothetical protein